MWFSDLFAPADTPEVRTAKQSKTDYYAAVNRRTPRKFTYTCHSPTCDGGIQGTDPVPDYYTPAPCWACDSDVFTTPRPIADRDEDDLLIKAYEEANQ